MRPVPAVVSALQGESAIRELVEDRVYGGELPAEVIEDTPCPPQACIVVQNAGGGGVGPGARSFLPWRVVRLSIRSYGETPDDSDKLDARVYDYMTGFDGLVDYHHQVILRDAVVSGGPLPGRDPDIRWPYVISIFDLSASSTE